MPGPSPVLLLHSSAGLYGADRQLLAIASGIDHARFAPLVVLPERGELAPLLEEAGIEVRTHPLAVLRRGLASPTGLARLARAVARDRRVLGGLARERGVRVVHANTSVMLSARAVARRAGAASVVHVREIYAGAAPGPLARLWPLQRRRLERADALACVSHATAAQFRARARVIHDGIAAVPGRAGRRAAREELGLGPDAFCVALLGRVSDWKGQDVLARALAAEPLAARGAIGLVAGDAFPGDEQHERTLARLAESLGLGERLRLLGFRADVDTVLGAADAVCVPSTRPDPLPNSALESAAAGLPLVAAAHGGLPEIVRDGETGLLVPPGDAAALAAALGRLAEDPEAARRMGAAAAADVAERFAMPRMIAAIEALYGEVLT